ncbi:hypothetical protein L2E82_35214 [Cichorium intybus]|uniref:Uncharacterized protein n=1 Tax=Cichorium intybus TaxID=13427 RepID=A0ACB9BNE6_CICIN|nr:hypothetical protein L2E82_35214 [Cichorium intybus]
MQMNYSLNVANSVGGSNRAPILIPTEYNGWASRMHNYLKTKGKDIWRSVEEGPHLLIITPRPNTAEEALGGTSQPRLTPLDIEKMDNDQIAFTEIQCGIPPELFDLIQNCTTAQQIWVLLQNMFLGTEEAKDQKLVSSVSEYTHFSTFFGESLSQAFTRFSIVVTRLLSSGAERTNQETNLGFLEGLGQDWVLVKMILQDFGKLKTFNMYRLYNNLIGQERDIKGNQQLQLGGPLALVAEHNHQMRDNTPQQLVQYQQTSQQQANSNASNHQITLTQNSSQSQQTNSIPSYHPSQPQISYPYNYQTPTKQYQSSPISPPTIQSKSPTLALPAPVQTSDSYYSEYDEAEEAAYQHEIALISQKFNRIPSYSGPKKNFRPSNQNGGFQPRNNHQRGHQHSSQNRHYQKPEDQQQEKAKPDPTISTNQVPTSEQKESDVIKCHNCGGLWHYAADCRAPRNYPKTKEEEKVKAFVASGNVEIWSSGDDDEQFENKRKRGKGFGECMMVQANRETPIPGLANTKHAEDTAESSSSYMPKNYAFMVNHKTGKGVSIIEQVRNMLHTHQIYSNNLEPALENISNTCADALAAYQRVLEERDDGYDEVIKLKNRLEDKKVFCDKLTADLKIEQTSRSLLENSNQLLTSQRDLARSDNVRLNKLVGQLYHATEVFKSPANTNSSENTFNWGWARKATNKNYPVYNRKSPFFQYPSNEYDDKHDKDTIRNTPDIESENATSESKIGVNIPFSYFSEADTAEISKLSIASVPFMPRQITTVTNYPSSISQQQYPLKCTSNNLENSNKDKIDEKIEIEKSSNYIIINKNFNKIKIRNPNATDVSNRTSESSNSKSSEDTSQLHSSSNSIKVSLKNLNINHEEIDSLNDSLSDSSPREIFQKGKGKNLTKQGVKPTLNRKDLRSPRSHARFEQKKCFYTKSLSAVNSTLITPSHTQKSTSLTFRKYIHKGLLPTPNIKPTQQAFSTEEQDDEWLIDSACSMHMTGRLEFLRDYKEVNFGGYVTFGNDANGIIKGYGVLINGNFIIQKVAYVLGLKHNLISVGQLVSTGLRVEFDSEFS